MELNLQPERRDMPGFDQLNESSRAAIGIYEARLKAMLEPDHNGEFVAIDAGSGEYALGRSSAVAGRELVRLHPDAGRVVVMKIGPEPEYGLAARILASQLAVAEPK